MGKQVEGVFGISTMPIKRDLDETVDMLFEKSKQKYNNNTFELVSLIYNPTKTTIKPAATTATPATPAATPAAIPVSLVTLIKIDISKITNGDVKDGDIVKYNNQIYYIDKIKWGMENF